MAVVIGNKMRTRMILTELRWKVAVENRVTVESVKLVGTKVEVTYSKRCYHGVKIHEGYIGESIIELLTCKDEDFETKLNVFCNEYIKAIDGCIEKSVKRAVLGWA